MWRTRRTGRRWRRFRRWRTAITVWTRLTVTHQNLNVTGRGSWASVARCLLDTITYSHTVSQLHTICEDDIHWRVPENFDTSTVTIRSLILPAAVNKTNRFVLCRLKYPSDAVDETNKRPISEYDFTFYNNMKMILYST